MEDQESSAYNTPHDVNVIDGGAPSNLNPPDPTLQGATDPVRTRAQHLNVINALLRESPFDPVAFPDVDNWVETIQSTMANLNSAFAAAAGSAAQGPSGLPRQPKEVQEDRNHLPIEVPSHPSHDPGCNPCNASPQGHRQ